MSQVIEVRMPGLGDAAALPVIEVLVEVGDAVKVDDTICVLESDKATMDVPSSAAGVVRDVLVKVGDKVEEGAVLLRLQAHEVATRPEPAPATAPSAPAPAVISSHAAGADLECDLLVLGGGPGGYSAAFRSADLGRTTVVVERYASLGGVCLNVGCIPSKALLHIASAMEEVPHLASLGIEFGAGKVDLDRLRAHKASVVDKLTGGLAGMARGRKVEVVRGLGRFLDPQHIEVAVTTGSGQEQTGEKKVIRFKQCVIAAGSQAVRLPFMPEDPRIVDSTGALELRTLPKRMLVVGGGIIGLEMATVYSALGARIDVVEMLDGLMQGPDRDLVQVWERHNRHRFDNLMLKTRTVKAEANEQGIWVTFEGEQAPAEPQCYDLVLVAVGRRPNGDRIDAHKAGVVVSERGFIAVDKQMRTNVPHIFAIGDIVGQPMLAHKAVHEGHVAAEVAAGEATNRPELACSRFDALQIPGVAYTNPEVAWAGLTLQEARDKGIKVEAAVFPWAASGRAIANGRDEGFTKLLFDAETHRVVGGGIVGTGAGDLISEVCLAIEMGADAVDIGKTIHPHPTLGETVGMAAEVAHGSCTDLPAARR
ncbi:dihydrolipoyl dehydrogenase [Pseudomonas citronellolis]|uniref:Dihydrolipoyl dehydrogenase n=1 Tax=Pseudomonas citronellolis TaxID=53408 RepID=A0AAW6PA13_9PSED|nr:dihydrolipoyl dehydrogenase [Pseudomonas citronellolis]MDF3843475.1 dihydrolipoyl dehydrogenase [Pseudomonas citronellolis]